MSVRHLGTSSVLRGLSRNSPGTAAATTTTRGMATKASGLSPADFFGLLSSRGVGYYAGVPDSLLKDFCAYITDTVPAGQHVIAANEGAAVGLAAGYHLSTGKTPAVYLQNSGLGNTVNPILSLCDPKVYRIPLLLLVGWRGEPGVHDEPQHVSQGRLTPALLPAMGVPFEVLPPGLAEAERVVDEAFLWFKKMQSPYALLVRKNTFQGYQLQSRPQGLPDFPMSREEAIRGVLAALPRHAAVVSTTGMISREVFEVREEQRDHPKHHHHNSSNKGAGTAEESDRVHERDFLTVGSMGHASAIALGIAMSQPDRPVVCVDGDGASLMHLGTLTTVGQVGRNTRLAGNLKHVVLNNAAHDSVGGQPTAGLDCNLTEIAAASGYSVLAPVTEAAELPGAVAALMERSGPAFLEVRVKRGARKDLGRPTTSAAHNKDIFMRFLRSPL